MRDEIVAWLHRQVDKDAQKSVCSAQRRTTWYENRRLARERRGKLQGHDALSERMGYSHG